ncbi:SpaH/EbpB family LPXTG-anchored major pilin [Breznakia pachnodae]|uniref:Fimbrial isopeptide formation D2 family protein/LPXTG-motif cell wall-anchored protein n=1 Tax=Breznakia pachnodae TaxID=265178 RepID=A0ABU0E400_9FIRM|nr:SpaH/EbpB family LPXTG-anchored major pilin [Breznakia pachnodae]MDQ0361220.1 fimbrial isopeptide formation D2 family protein/LPXTG-motif cell wall-anchored protein [Breznakia pachnodae]
MKRIKKIIYAIFALTMVVGLFSANTQANDSLPADTGSLTIHKYLMDDVNNAGPNGIGTELTPAQLPTGAAPLQGVAFDLYKIDTTAGVPMGGDVKYTISGTTLTVDDNGTKTTYPLTLVSQQLTDVNGEAKWSALAKGYYFAVENLADSTPKTAAGDPVTIGTSVAPFVVAVPMTNPAGSGWLTDVHAYPKNEPLTVDKEVDDTSVTVGDIVKYTIKPSVPSDIETSKSYVVTDLLDEALTFDATSLKVYELNGDGSVNTAKEIAASNYTVAQAPSGTSNKITVTFNDTGRSTALKGKKKIGVVFNAAVNSKVLDKIDHSVENKASVSFTNEYDQASTTESTPTNTHTGSVKIEKTANDTSNALAGAKFQIASSLANAKAGNYLKKDAAGNIIDFGETGYAAANVWELTTDASGIAIFEGLEDYTGTAASPVYNSYWLVETFAPGDYNLLSDPVQVTFTAGSTSANAYTHTVGVVNTKEFVLPSTGGNGTVIFTIAGIAIIGLAGIMLITSKKSKKGNI